MMKEVIKHKKIRIGASSVCQLRCPSCPTARKATLPILGKGFLRLKDFRALIDENAWIKEIELSNYGEIFLNPDLLEIMRYVYEKKVLLTANNGVNLNNVKKEVLEGLVKYRFVSMTCSIDGTNSETYAKYRVGGNYDAVISNIEVINHFKKKYRTNYPMLAWQFILFGHNQKELLKAKRLAKSLKMNFFSKLSYDSELSPWSEEIAKKQFGVVSREEYKKKYGVDYMQWICHLLWDNPQINWDGKVLGCCFNYWGDFDSNVFDDGLIEALNNEKINYAKGMLLGIYEEKDDIPCTTCDIYLTMKTNAKWLERSVITKLKPALLEFVPHQIKPLIHRFNRLKKRFSGR
jgi:MoaA/NifB/PqqE/SkfB family radical SAM enzyme